MAAGFNPELIECRTLVNDSSVVDLYKVGGGTLGKTYAGMWGYRLYREERLIASGEDLYTGTPKTHDEAAQLVLDFYPNQE